MENRGFEPNFRAKTSVTVTECHLMNENKYNHIACE